jgi:hypothetical protein
MFLTITLSRALKLAKELENINKDCEPEWPHELTPEARLVALTQWLRPTTLQLANRKEWCVVRLAVARKHFHDCKATGRELPIRATLPTLLPRRPEQLIHNSNMVILVEIFAGSNASITKAGQQSNYRPEFIHTMLQVSDES